MKEYLTNVFVWHVSPVVAQIDRFRNWIHRKEIAQKTERIARQRKANKLCDELLRMYMNALLDDRVDYDVFDRQCTTFTEKVNHLYFQVR